jgi:hypothetical protein
MELFDELTASRSAYTASRRYVPSSVIEIGALTWKSQYPLSFNGVLGRAAQTPMITRRIGHAV